MPIYVLEFDSNLPTDLAQVARDMTVALETAFSKRRTAFRVLDRRDLGLLRKQQEREYDAVIGGKKPSTAFLEQLKGAKGFVRGELGTRFDGVLLTVSLVDMQSEKLWQGQKRHTLIEWLKGENQGKAADELAADAQAALLPETAPVGPGDDGPRGIELAKAGDCKTAMPYLRNASVVDLNNAEIYKWMGHCHNLAGNYAEAAQSLTAALSRNPTRADLFTERARALLAQRQYSRALEDADRALTFNPNDMNAMELKGDALLQAGRFNDAVGAYYEAHEREPTLNRCRKLTEAYRKNGVSQAADAMQRTCSNYPAGDQ